MKLVAALFALALVPLLPAQESETRFQSFDLFLDAGAQPLAAWQVEVVDPSGRAQIVGIEGGDGAAFTEPAHYDPRALQGGRIVLAALSTGDDLPLGRARVARLHFSISGPEDPPFEARLQAAAGPDARRIEARVELVR